MSDLRFHPTEFRAALSAFATGVTIITTQSSDGTKAGLTANSFSSLSLSPPLVLWSIGKSSSNFAAFASARYFAVHVLSADQQPLAALFAARGADKFASLVYDTDAEGVPLLRDCAARFRCRSWAQYEGGDHLILVGEVLEIERNHRLPLVFHSGAYGSINQPMGSVPPADTGR